MPTPPKKPTSQTQLRDLCRAVLSDGEASVDEIKSLYNWLRHNEYPDLQSVGHLKSAISQAAADKKITPDERLKIQEAVKGVLVEIGVPVLRQNWCPMCEEDTIPGRIMQGKLCSRCGGTVEQGRSQSTLIAGLVTLAVSGFPALIALFVSMSLAGTGVDETPGYTTDTEAQYEIFRLYVPAIVVFFACAIPTSYLTRRLIAKREYDRGFQSCQNCRSVTHHSFLFLKTGRSKTVGESPVYYYHVWFGCDICGLGGWAGTQLGAVPGTTPQEFLRETRPEER